MEESHLLGNNPRPTTLKRINMRRFLEELRRRGPSTRADLTRATGVTPPTSSSIIADLLATGLLEEGESSISGKGRPGKFFHLAGSRAFVLGATIDIRTCCMAPSGLDGKPRAADRVVFDTPNNYRELLDTIVSQAKAITSKTEGKCHGIGLAVPGLVHSGYGRVSFSPNLHFLDGRDLGSDLEALLGIKVVCTQEEQSLCLSEQYSGEADGLTDYAVVDFSSGVGMGVVSGGRYVSGAQGYAGEIGHTTVEPEGRSCGCGNRGCLETVASDIALLRNLSDRLGREVDMKEVRTKAGSDPAVDEEIDRMLSYVAIGLATVVNLFNPEAVFVHGQTFQLSAEVMRNLEMKVKSRALKPSFEETEIRLAHGDKLHGAIAGLLNNLFAAVGPILQ